MTEMLMSTYGKARKVRCRILDEKRNPCASEQLTDLGFCFHHLREAAEEWKRVCDDAAAQFPGLKGILAPEGNGQP